MYAAASGHSVHGSIVCVKGSSEGTVHSTLLCASSFLVHTIAAHGKPLENYSTK